MEDSKGLPAFFLGLGIGVAIGILFAPKSGEETRDLLKSKAGEGKDFLLKRSEELKESATDAVERGRHAVQRQKDQLAAAVEAGRQAYRESMAAGAGSAAAERPAGS